MGGCPNPTLRSSPGVLHQEDKSSLLPGVTEEPGEVENSTEKMSHHCTPLWNPGQKQLIAKEPGADRPYSTGLGRVPKEAGGILSPPRQTLVHPFPGACSILGVLVNTNLEFSRWPSNLQAHLRPDI